MSINEYAADAADEWLPLRIAGSLDNGAIDVEYSPVHKIAADERHDDHEQRLHQLESEMRAANESIAQAWKYVELLLHRPANETPDSDDGLTAAYMLGAYDGKHGTGTGTDYAHIPLAEWQDITTELEWLRLQRPTQDEDGVLIDNEAWAVLQRDAAIGASVPWEALEWVWAGAASVNAAPSPDIEAVKAWIDAHAPKEAAE
jgi:hypothetical protein